jgi:hypothetical protein
MDRVAGRVFQFERMFDLSGTRHGTKVVYFLGKQLVRPLLRARRTGNQQHQYGKYATTPSHHTPPFKIVGAKKSELAFMADTV